MDIVTSTIKDSLEILFNKPIENISVQELDKVRNIKIDRLGFENKINKVNYDEILLFKNLEELNIFNCMLNKQFMTNISKLNSLKKLNIYNSDFVDFIEDSFLNLHLDELVISNCLGLKNITLKNLKYLELKNIEINFLVKNVAILNIANAHTNINFSNIVNVNQIIISEKDYYEKKNSLSLVPNVVVVNNKMEKIKEVKND